MYKTHTHLAAGGCGDLRKLSHLLKVTQLVNNTIEHEPHGLKPDLFSELHSGAPLESLIHSFCWTAQRWNAGTSKTCLFRTGAE